MLNDATCFKAVYIVCGYTDLRSGIDRLAAAIEAQTDNKPYVPDTLYLFCGRRADRRPEKENIIAELRNMRSICFSRQRKMSLSHSMARSLQS